MATRIGNGVRLHDYNMEDWIFTFAANQDIITLHNMTGSTAIGRAVQVDASVDGGVELAADDGAILGRIEAVEQRTQEGINLVAVAIKFSKRMQKKTGAAIARNTSVVGAGSGLVKTATLNLDNNYVPIAADSAATEVVVMKF